MNERASELVVRCTAVARTFRSGPNAVVALHEATFDVWSRQRIAIVGASGSGKTTLLHLLAGLDRPTAGTIEWPALGERTTLRPGPVAIVFQGPSLVPPLDVVENVALPLVLAHVSDEEARGRAHAALGRLDLTAITNKLPEELSGGQLQRVAIARAIAEQPQLLLADEPTGQLDHETASHVVDVLLDAATGTGAALVVTTHDDAVADLLDMRWPISDGRLTLPDHPVRARPSCSV